LSRAGQRRHTAAALAGLGAVGLVLLSFAALVAIPVTLAESHAAEARALAARGLPAEAVAAYRQAFDAAPVANAYYAQRAADLSERRGAWREALALRSLAIAADEATSAHWRDRALLGRAAQDSAVMSADAIAQDYAAAVTRDPSNSKLHAEFGDFLLEIGRSAEAKSQFEKAIWIDQRLDPNERRRLAPDVLARIRAVVGQ
jgi:tetratricopeptide (TPR) repeat protein